MVNDPLSGPLEAAAERVADDLSDITRALDVVAPRAFRGELDATRRFVVYYRLASDRISNLVATAHPDIGVGIVARLLQDGLLEVCYIAPRPDGIGILSAMLDKTRWLSGSTPMQLSLRVSDPESWRQFSHAVEVAVEEQRAADPLSRVMTIFDLNAAEMGNIMGVTRQAIEKWRLSGPPAERSERIVTIAEIASILHRRLRAGHVPAVVRRPSERFGGRSFLEALAAGEEREVLAAVRSSFDYASVA
ncbi:MAG: hypothetical protein ACLP50_14925 [Solirubrobacteraceae bacterium]